MGLAVGGVGVRWCWRPADACGSRGACYTRVAQVTCYEDSRLLKLFADVVKILYDADVLGEDTIRFW